MTRHIRLSALLLVAASAAACTIPQQVRAETTSDAGTLTALTDAIERDQLETSFAAQFRDGKPVTAFVDYSLPYLKAREAKRTAWQAALAKIRPESLSAVDRTTYQILSFDLSTGTDEAEYWLTFDLTPYQAPMDLGAANQVMAAHPLTTAAEADDYVRLTNAYADMIDSLTEKVAAQTARGIYLPKPVLPVIRSTWTAIASGTAALKPAEERTAKLGEAERSRLKTQINQIVTRRLLPRYTKIGAMIGSDYESKTSETVGLAQFAGGKDVYRKLIRRYTTLDVTPEQLRDQGLAAVASLQIKMHAIRTQLGFQGTSREFYEKLSTDPRFVAKTPADVEATYWGYIHAIEPKLPSYFSVLPKAPYGVKRLPLAAEPGQTFGYYGPPTSAEPKGIYYYNGSHLDKRSLVNAGTLIYHELLPGHHFQFALQNENAALAPYRQHYLVGAYNEGWGEYAASLGIELKLYPSPETLYGRYVNEIFLASRLVVDTGLNYFGWPLEKARSYMRDVTSNSDIEIASETLRYSVNIPGQALAYRTGYDKFWELRLRAEKELGKTFDIRMFHDIILSGGARPMIIVEKDVNSYIEQQARRRRRSL